MPPRLNPQHALGLSSETRDENDDEPSGRGLIARKPVNDGERLFSIPLNVSQGGTRAMMARAATATALHRHYESTNTNNHSLLASLPSPPKHRRTHHHP